MFGRSSLMPRLLGNDYWDLFDYPSNLASQDFGDILDPFDVFEPLTTSSWYDRPRRQRSSWDQGRLGWGGQQNQNQFGQQPAQQGQLQRRQQQSGISSIQNDPNQFALALDCRHFNPNEIEVSYGDNNDILIKGKHEERSDEHGYVSREFTRRYVLPRECELDKVNAQFNQNGQLCITCPKQPVKQQVGKGRTIPIQGVGQQQSLTQGQQGQQQGQIGQQGQQHQGQQFGQQSQQQGQNIPVTGSAGSQQHGAQGVTSHTGKEPMQHEQSQAGEKPHTRAETKHQQESNVGKESAIRG